MKSFFINFYLTFFDNHNISSAINKMLDMIFLNYLDSLNLIKIFIPITILSFDHFLRVLRWKIILSSNNKSLKLKIVLSLFYFSFFEQYNSNEIRRYI